jgi:hypothetical protein
LKNVFFEKKKQKTFAHGSRLPSEAGGARAAETRRMPFGAPSRTICYCYAS